MSPRSSSPPHSRRGEQCRRGHLPLLIRGGESNVAVVIFPSSFEEGRAMSPWLSSPPLLRRGARGAGGVVVPRRLKCMREKTRARLLQSGKAACVRGAARAARDGGRCAVEP